jgi:hypothetical protein
MLASYATVGAWTLRCGALGQGRRATRAQARMHLAHSALFLVILASEGWVPAPPGLPAALALARRLAGAGAGPPPAPAVTVVYWDEQPSTAVQYWVRCVVFGLLGLAMARESNRLLDGLALFFIVAAVFIGLGRSGAAAADVAGPPALHLVLLPLAWAVLPGLLFVLLQAQRARTRAWVRNTLTGPDRAAARAAWAAFLAGPGGAADVRRLAAFARGLPDGAGAARPGQLAAGVDHLYEQAAVLDLFLRRKAWEWAGRSNGLLPATAAPREGGARNGGAGGVSADGEGEEEGAAAAGQAQLEPCRRIVDAGLRVVWAGLKPWRRTAEKLLRCYDFDAACLLDVCRQAGRPPLLSPPLPAPRHRMSAPAVLLLPLRIMLRCAPSGMLDSD